MLRARGVVVYLDADLDTLAQRTRRDRDRPLLRDGDRRETLEELMKKRAPLYRREADVIVKTSRRSPLTVARKIAAELRVLDRDENT